MRQLRSDVIEGKPSLSAEAQRALILAAGHELWVEDGATATKVTVTGRRAGSDRTSSMTWTLDDAKRANLAGKTNWRMYPRQMLTARATADLARAIFADVIGGLAATEELEDVDPFAVAEATETPSPGTKRRRRRTSRAVVAATESGAEPGEETVSSPELPPLPDAPAEPLLEPKPDAVPSRDPESGEPREGSPADDGLDFGESAEATPAADDAREDAQDDETTASSAASAKDVVLPREFLPGDPSDDVSGFVEDDATKAQKKALDSLVGRLRTTEVELEDESKAPVLSTEQLWAASANRRRVSVDEMIELLNGRDPEGVLHWAPLRDSLTKSEASDLIAKLEDRARKWGIE